jgi:hypothetical protein
MKLHVIVIAGLLTAAVGGAVIAFSGDRLIPQELPPLSATPQIQPIRLVEATPFQLVEAHTHFYRAEQPAYTEGTLLVLAVEPHLLTPRQTYESVLYVGSETAERINVGERSGHLIALIPGQPDLANTPIFFGEPELPERITAQEAQRQLALAQAAGVVPAGAEAAAAAAQEAVELYDGYELHRFASYAVERYSADEQDLIKGLRAERIGG